MRAPSRLVYDVADRGFARFRGSIALDNARSEIGSTLNPAIRFFVFDSEPNMDRLLPPAPQLPLPAPPTLGTAAEAVDRLFMHALGRAPSPAERRIAVAAVAESRAWRPSVGGWTRRSAVGAADEARVPADLLKELAMSSTDRAGRTAGTDRRGAHGSTRA